MAVINEWTQAALEVAFQRGFEEGFRQGLVPFLRILRRRAGELPVDLETQLRNLSPSQLEELADATLMFGSPGDLTECLARFA